MKSLILTLLLSSLAFSSSSIYVSHHNKLTKVSKRKLANLYLKKTNFINGIRVVPIDSKNKKLFQEFYRKVIKKSPKQLHAYWVKEIYRGNKQPPKKLSPKEVKKFKKRRKSIIYYKKNPKTGRILLTIK